MASGSMLFSNAVLSSTEYKLLSGEKLGRMADANTPIDALKVLYEVSYADGMTVETASEYEKLIERESNSLYDFISFLMPNKQAADCLFLENDYHNIKTLLKAKYAGIKTPEILLRGRVKVESLESAVETDSYYFLPSEIKNAAEGLSTIALSRKVTPSLVDITMDRTYVTELTHLLKGAKSKTLTRYFERKADFSNLATVVRCMLLQTEVKDFLMPMGSFSQDFLIELAALSPDAFAEKLRYTDYKFFAEQLAAILAGESTFFEYEKAVDNYLLSLFRSHRNDSASIDRIMGFYFARLVEMKNIRIVLAGLLAGADRSRIKERLRDCYVQ